MGLHSFVCEEMKQTLKRHKASEALKKKFDDLTDHHLFTFTDEAQIKLVKNKRFRKLSLSEKQTTLVLSLLLRLSVLIWYIFQVLCVYNNDRGSGMVFACTLLPIVLYYIQLNDQCKVKLFQYLSGWKSSSGPSIMKILLVVWCGIAMLFGATQLLWKFNDISTLRNKIILKNNGTTTNHDLSGLTHVSTSTHVSSIDYPLCMIEQERNGIMDATFLSNMVYQKSLTNNTIKAIDLYFAAMYNETSPWEISIHNSMFFHLKNRANPAKHMIIVRGTSVKRDFYEDLTLYSEVLALRSFSKIFPITELWPQTLIQGFIKKMSVTEGIIFNFAQNRHHHCVGKYIQRNIIHNINGTGFELTIAGHSLGGAISHIVGAQLKEKNPKLNIRTIGISNPGLVWSSAKFGVNVSILSRISTTIVPDSDPITKFDKHTGTVHHIQCKQNSQRECHSVQQTLFELYDACFDREKEQKLNTTEFRVFMENFRIWRAGESNGEQLERCLRESGAIP